jgi:hypothetical protein
MPSTLSEVFAAAGAERGGVVRWGERIAETRAGVYAVSTTDAIDSAASSTSAAPISRDALEQLLIVRPDLRLGGARPTVDDVRDRLRQFWLADEVVLYIGRAKALRRRVDQYYATRLGAAKPHASGWWLKTLDSLDDLWVHWAATPDYRLAEKRMLQAFAAGVSRASARKLRDAERVMPFANLLGHDNRIKRHEISGARGTLAARSEGSSPNAGQRTSVSPVVPSSPVGSGSARLRTAPSGTSRRSSSRHAVSPICSRQSSSGRVSGSSRSALRSAAVSSRPSFDRDTYAACHRAR